MVRSARVVVKVRKLLDAGANGEAVGVLDG
jgi:hypothetical protein